MEQSLNTNTENRGMDLFHRQRQEFEIDLIQDVRKLLVDSGLNDKVTAAYDNNHFILNAMTANAEVQRYALNRFWNLQLVQSAAPSTQERFCLITNGSGVDWFTLFKAKVLPFIISNDLPK